MSRAKTLGQRACSICGATTHHPYDCPVQRENIRREAQLEVLDKVRFIIRSAIRVLSDRRSQDVGPARYIQWLDEAWERGWSQAARARFAADARRRAVLKGAP